VLVVFLGSPRRPGAWLSLAFASTPSRAGCPGVTPPPSGAGPPSVPARRAGRGADQSALSCLSHPWTRQPERASRVSGVRRLSRFLQDLQKAAAHRKNLQPRVRSGRSRIRSISTRRTTACAGSCTHDPFPLSLCRTWHTVCSSLSPGACRDGMADEPGDRGPVAGGRGVTGLAPLDRQMGGWVPCPRTRSASGPGRWRRTTCL